MKDKLNQFISNLNGQFVEVSYKEAIYQCMDLAYNWIFTLGIPKATIQQGAAYQAWTNASDLTRQYFDLIENKLETIPQEGDLVVWNNKYGKYGHIAIVVEATQTKMTVFEQNNPLGTNAHVQDRSYTNVSGFLRPIKFTQIESPKIVELEGQLMQWKQHFEDIKEHLRLAGVMPGDDLPKLIGAIDGLIAKKQEYEEHLKQEVIDGEKPDETHPGYDYSGKWDVGKWLIEFYKKEVKQ